MNVAAEQKNEQPPAPTAPAIGELAKALASAQASFRVAVQDGINPHFHSKYATLASIMQAAQPALSQAGLAVLQIPSMEGKEVSVQTLLAHASGQTISCTLTAAARNADPQAIGSVISYLRRYGLASLLGIAAGEDDDGEAATDHERQPTKPLAAKVRAAEVAPGFQAGQGDDDARRSSAMKRIHAIGREVGLDNKALRGVLAVSSMTDPEKCSTELLLGAGDLLSSPSLDDLKDAWGAVRSLGLGSKLQGVKDWAKGRLATP